MCLWYIGSSVKGDVSLLDLRGRQRQVGSLAGAAHLLKDNAGVLRWSQREQKSLVEEKAKVTI